jgi:LCP family protein required for cell wall assembly
MASQPAPKRNRTRWLVIFAAGVVALFLLLTAYTSYTVYGLVRDWVAHSGSLSPVIPVAAALQPAQQPTDTPAAQAASNTPVAPAGTAAPGGNEPTPAPGATPAFTPFPTAGPAGRVNILLLGIDQRQGEAGPFRTDTMIVVSIDTRSGQLSMLSIPRDLWVPIPGYGENRINTANFTGDLRKYPGGGPALAKRTVAYNFGMPINYYVRLNFEGFKRIIDTIGGIDIYVEKEIRDDLYPDEHYGYEPLYIPAGMNHMDGDLALKYARTRKTDNDFQRAHRQQQVILAVKDKILSLDLLPSLVPKLPELSRALADSVQTDMPLDEIMRLARLSATLDMNNIKSAVIDDTMTVPQTTPQGAAVLLPLREKIRPLIDELFWAPAPTPAKN